MTPEEKRAHEAEMAQRRAEKAAADEQARIERQREHEAKMAELREQQRQKNQKG